MSWRISGGTMPNRQRLCVLIFLLGAIISATASGRAQSSRGQEYSGTWSGTWDGSGSGDFELTLEQTKDGAIGGKVAVTTDGGNYNAELKTVVFDGNRMNATYEFPLDPSAE